MIKVRSFGSSENAQRKKNMSLFLFDVPLQTGSKSQTLVLYRIFASALFTSKNVSQKGRNNERMFRCFLTYYLFLILQIFKG